MSVALRGTQPGTRGRGTRPRGPGRAPGVAPAPPGPPALGLQSGIDAAARFRLEISNLTRDALCLGTTDNGQRVVWRLREGARPSCNEAVGSWC